MHRLSKAMPGPSHDYGQSAPQIVRDVLREPGRPLDPVTRHTMESSFRHSFAGIRVHADERAAASAKAIDARAYTVGNDVVFGGGEYAPHSDAGRRLVAHELAHTIQQEHTGARIQRACVNTPCPPLAVSVDAFFPRYEAAEKCIQTEYARTHPASKAGISLSYNAEWQHLTGGTRNEVMALNCLRGLETPGAGPNFTARSGMFAAAPDIWDFRNQTMYEITTAKGAAVRIGKLKAEIALANRICSPADCGGLQFMTGPWAPNAGCYALGGDLYFSAFNTQGVIVYQMLKDTAKEVALAALLALMAAALKKSGGAAGGAVKAVAGAGARKLVPAYAVASLIAAAVLLTSGRAEAKPLSGEDPLAALFQSLEQQGTPVPPEIQEMLDADPALRQKISDAMKEGGNPTKVQEELNKQVLDLIAKNKDQFTAEELEVLLASARVTGKAMPQGELTVAELKKLAAAKGVPGEGGDGTAMPDSAARRQLAEAAAPVRDLYKSMLGGNAEKTTDAHIQRFLSMLPPGLSAEDAATLRTMLQKSDASSIDAVLDSLQAAIAQLGKAAPPEGDATGDTATKPTENASGAAPPPANATLSTEPGTPGATPIDHQKLVNDLAAEVRKSKFGDLGMNQYRIAWRNRNPKGAVLVGDAIEGTLRGKNAAGVTYVGRIEAIITAVNGSNIQLKFITASPMVAADGTIIYPASHYLGREDNVTLDPPKKKK